MGYANQEEEKKAVNMMSLPELKVEAASIQTELGKLANYTLRGGIGSVGYRSPSYTSANRRLLIEVDLETEEQIDQVVLVPSLWRDTQVGVRSEGFPIAFRIIVGSEEDSQVVASYTEEDKLLPRIAPLVVSFSPRQASWVRIEVTEMSLLISEEQHILQLSEVFVFSGAENVALQKKAFVQSSNKKEKVSSLTDGFTPYLMDAAGGSLSQTKVMSVIEAPSLPTLTLDLGEEYSVNQINLHTAHTSLSIPMKTLGMYNMPSHVRISGARDAEFSDEFFLCEYHQRSPLNTGPMIMRRFDDKVCRYIKLTIVDSQPVASFVEEAKAVAFSEIEVLSKGGNVSYGAEVVASGNLRHREKALGLMTDGLNYYGEILPLRVWLEQLARRHDLEVYGPVVSDELAIRYERQKIYLQWAIWMSVVLAVGIAFTFMIVRYRHMRDLAQYKERFAADLHDELGANLHTIGLLSDLAEVSKESPRELSGYLERIRAMTERSGHAVQYVTNLNESRELFSELVMDMKRSSERILTQLEHDFSVEGEEYLSRLKPRTSVDLFLFYKECLVNTCRHSNATHLQTRLIASPKEVRLSIKDNGKGIEHSHGVPKSLSRRAGLLKAKIKVESASDGGTAIYLKLRNRK